MKKTVKIKAFIVLLIIFFATVTACLAGGFSTKTASAATVDDNYRFDSINVDITVNKDKTFNITETLEVNFLYSEINTGIIRDIQRVSKTTRIVDGKSRDGGTYLAGVSDVSVTYDGGYCLVTESLYNNGEFYSVKMQQPSGYIEAGVHTFVLKYVYDMSDDKISGLDDFTFDVLGYAMAFTSNFTAKITFPAGTDLSNVTYRTVDKSDEMMTWVPDAQAGEAADIEGNIIYITANPQASNKGYTVQVLLPDGYFSHAEKTFYWYYVIFAIGAFAGIVVVAVIFIKCVNRKKPIETVEFYPPEGMSVMRFASVWRKGAKNKDTAALILKWAGMGLVTIEADGTYNCTVKVNGEAFLKKGGKFFDTEEERNYFDTLFSGIGGGELSFSTSYFKSHAKYDDKKKLYSAANRLIAEGDRNPVLAYKDFSLQRTLVLFLCLIPTLMTVIYYCILNASALPIVFLIFMVAGALPVLPMENMKFPLAYPFPLAFYGVVYCAFYLIFGLTAYDYCGLLYISPVMWFLGTFVLRWFMVDVRVPQVMGDYGKMRGFKNFLLKAELPRIQVLFDEDPFYFAEILPYCLIMGISEKVKKRFASLNIRVPEYLERGVNIHSFSTSISRSCSAGAPRSSGGGGGHGGSHGGGGGGGGSRGC